jgi:hypothetical protein
MSSVALDLCIPRPGQPWTETQLSAVDPCLERMGAFERLQYFNPGYPWC